MATLRPELTETRLEQIPSKAEARFYRACRDQLGRNYLVLHSISFLINVSGAPREGEADFVITSPDDGIFVIEIKGGGVEFDPINGAWYSMDAVGRRNPIKDPFRQATHEKHALLQMIKSHPHWKSLGIDRLLIGHAVFLPDVENPEKLALSHAPKEIIGGRKDLQHLAAWLKKLGDYWRGEQKHSWNLGVGGMHIVEDLFCQPRKVRPLLATELADEESMRIRLTEQQTRVLRALGNRKRAAICGGAGTGKTLLALEKARQLAILGNRTLLLCYNRPLADYLNQLVEHQQNLITMDFHQYCQWRIKVAQTQTARNYKAEALNAYGNQDFFEVQLPYALALALEDCPDQYDALIVDEGQDFREEYWFPVEMLIRETDNSSLYIFYDQNQAIYHHVSTFPIKEPPFLLSTNCRNTEYIHHAAYRHFLGDPTDPPEIKGAPIAFCEASSPPAQAMETYHLVKKLLLEEKVSPDNVVVLVESSSKHTFYDLLKQRRLPNGVKWAMEEHKGAQTVLVDTIKRFKGLESNIVILCGMDGLTLESDRETIYVALSRAKSRLFLIATKRTANMVLG